MSFIVEGRIFFLGTDLIRIHSILQKKRGCLVIRACSKVSLPTRAQMWSLISLAVASSAQDGDCYVDPSICGVKPFQQCISCGAFGRDPTKGCCISPPSSADCYMDVGICGETKWCQLNDRKSWNETDKSTKGRCVEYQSLCYTCTSTYEEVSNASHIELVSYRFLSSGQPADRSGHQRL
jgi:hypothetical protein